MESGIVVLTQKGSNALKSISPELNAVCRNILVQVDGKKSTDEILVMFRGLKGLEDSMQKLLAGGYIKISRECRDLVKSLALHMLGPKAPTFIKKIDEMHSKYGDACWTHLEELDKTARLFYGEVIANNLRTGIEKIITETKKTA